MKPAPRSSSASAPSPALRSFEAQWLAREADSLSVLREKAMQRVLNLGLPTTRDESWRYTNLRHLTSANFVDAPRTLPGSQSTPSTLGLADHGLVVLVNGHALQPLVANAYKGLEIHSLRELSRTNPDLVAAYLEPLPDTDRERWALLNTALFEDGLYIKVTGAAKPLVIRHVLAARGPYEAAHPRIIIDAAPGSSATIVEHFVDGVEGGESTAHGITRFVDGVEGSESTAHGVTRFVDGTVASESAAHGVTRFVDGTVASESAAHGVTRFVDGVEGGESTTQKAERAEQSHSPLCNAVTHLTAARESTIEYYRVYSTGASGSHVDSLTIHQDAYSRCKHFTIALGGALIRTTLDARLNQAGAELDSYALLVGAQARHVDCVNVATHNARDTRSRQTARAIASGTSRVVFNSKVVVNAGAVHADSQQSCRGLLLAPTAEIDTRPQLEIHADEVKCAHGATIGRLDPDMLFYLLSRGLDRDTAQSLLVYAFLADVLTGMSLTEAREAIETALIAQLPDAKILEKFR